MTHQTAPIPEPKPTTYTPAQRQQIAEAFRQAKAALWDGTPLPHGEKPSACRDGIVEYICHALAHSRHPARYTAKEIIGKRIQPYSSYETWLLDYYKREQLTKPFLQPLRHQWLDSLIKEFSQ